MGKTFQADIPNNAYRVTYHNASVASDGANAGYVIMRAPNNIKITGAYWTPYDADQTGHATSYRRVQIVNGGTAGTGTTVIASLNITASKASKSLNALSGTGTVTSGGAVVFSILTVGGAKNTETILRAGMVQVEYMLL